MSISPESEEEAGVPSIGIKAEIKKLTYVKKSKPLYPRTWQISKIFKKMENFQNVCKYFHKDLRIFYIKVLQLN